MSETLFSATLATAKLITPVVDSEATSDGAAGKTTLVDANFPFTTGGGSAPPDDYYNFGTVWFVTCSSASVANQGDTRVISDYELGTSPAVTFTFAAADAVTKDGDLYSVSDWTYPRFVLRQGVSYILSEIGGEDLQYSDAAYITVANQMNYDLPTGKFNIKRVEIASNTSAPYDYVTVPKAEWYVINNDLFFTEFQQPTVAGYRIRLTYNVPLTALDSDDDALPDQYDINWIKWGAAAYCMRWKVEQMRGQDPDKIAMFQESIARAERNAARYRPQLNNLPEPNEGSAWTLGGTVDYVGEPGKVRVYS
jgi:hypothetical protein